MKKLISLFVTALALASCGGGDNPIDRIQYLPFQEAKDGNWGMVSPDGEVLFSDEFKECPTLAANDRFFAKSGDGNYELYTADKKPLAVGKQEYSQAGVFYDDVTPVVRPNQPIEFIDKDGNVKVVLKTFEGKSVESCYLFSDGVSVVQAEGKYGVVNTSGKTVVKPEYDQMFQPKDHKIVATKKKGDKVTVFFLSTDGKVLTSFPMDKFESVGSNFIEGVNYAIVDKGGTTCCGFIDEKAEWVLKPMTKVKQVKDVRNGTFIYFDGENMGVMDLKGEVVLRAKYKSLFYADDSGKLFFAQQNEKGAQWKLIDSDGNALGSDEYDDVFPFIGDRAVVKISDSEVAFINKKGEDQKVKADIFDISFNEGTTIFYSEYVDLDGIVAQMKLEKNSMGGVTLDMKPKQVADMIKQVTHEDLFGIGGQGYYYMNLPLTVAGEESNQIICFSDLAYSVDDDNNFEYTDAPIFYIQNTFDFSGKLESHARDIFEAVKKKVKGFGKVTDDSDGSMTVEVSANVAYKVEIDGSKVVVTYGEKSVVAGDAPVCDDVDYD